MQSLDAKQGCGRRPSVRETSEIIFHIDTSLVTSTIRPSLLVIPPLGSATKYELTYDRIVGQGLQDRSGNCSIEEVLGERFKVENTCQVVLLRDLGFEYLCCYYGQD